MADAESFTKDLRRFDRQFENLLTEVFIEVAKEARLTVAERTPILTGRHSASWNASVGSPNYNAKPPSYNNPGGAPQDGEVNVDGFQLGQNLFIANGAPIILALNAGWSQKAPAGFIEAVGSEVQNMIPRHVSRLRAKYRL